MTSHQNIKKIMIPKYQEDVKKPRACDLCQNKHAVWYCASDDAFLCHVCDESVHSANHVATKHERVCLRTNEISNDVLQGTTSNPVWHSGFRRKARTPRSRCENKTQQKIDDERRREDPRVPEIGGEAMFFIPEANDDEDDMTSLVPEFEGFTEMGFFLSNHNGTDETTKQFNFDAIEDLYYNEEEEEDPKTKGAEACPGQSKTKDYDNIIAISAKVEESEDYVKKDYDKVIAISAKAEESEDNEINAKQRNMLLRLNYENVIAAWDKQESPTNNTSSNLQLVPPGIEEEKKMCNRSEREAKVWKYRDKRKNRLFEKKIRYEVRKVNADKRPRMKGRFVRRSLATDS